MANRITRPMCKVQRILGILRSVLKHKWNAIQMQKIKSTVSSVHGCMLDGIYHLMQ